MKQNDEKRFRSNLYSNETSFSSLFHTQVEQNTQCNNFKGVYNKIHHTESRCKKCSTHIRRNPNILSRYGMERNNRENRSDKKSEDKHIQTDQESRFCFPIGIIVHIKKPEKNNNLNRQADKSTSIEIYRPIDSDRIDLDRECIEVCNDYLKTEYRNNISGDTSDDY